MAAAAAYGTKFDVLLGHFDVCKQNNANGIVHSTDVAVDLENALAALNQADDNAAAGEDEAAAEEGFTALLESSVKGYVDLNHDIDCQLEILRSMRQALTAGQDLGGGGGVDLVTYFETQFAAAKEQWAARSDVHKYHKDTAYVEFKQKLWEERHPNRPFTLGGEQGLAGDEVDADDDDDFAIVSQVESYKCPLTQLFLEDPLTSKVCNHSYSSDAIKHHIKESLRTQPHGRAECPVAGCKHYVSLTDLKPNKKLKKQADRQRAQIEAEGDDDYAVVN
ncbi:hypothetical protein HDU87_003444 [Geranomyces variabilis]|uniref:SP-RING-type domain-containing protein n=1 Tax=Geranomyces variabilis TaxID=109894 RepID=A0AAD5TJV5_9FUNG|nr:hypothetical protein HDU87_003444 [Geranomyces variabilis]